MAEPAITVRAYHTSAGSNASPTRVVIHATAGNRQPFPAESKSGVAHQTALYFTSPTSGGSAHYIADAAHEEHCVPDSVIAWHAPPNEHSIGIEICANADYTRAQWLDPAVWPAVTRAAARTRELCLRFGIPMVKLSSADLLAGKHGICGHVDVSNAWHQTSHTDPGPGFPWDRFMVALNGAPAPAPAPAPTPAGSDSLPSLSYGQTSEGVKSLQRFLNAYGWSPALPLLPVTGFYGDQTTAVLKSAQVQMRIVGGDGRNVGPQTKAALWARGWRG